MVCLFLNDTGVKTTPTAKSKVTLKTASNIRRSLERIRKLKKGFTELNKSVRTRELNETQVTSYSLFEVGFAFKSNYVEGISNFIFTGKFRKPAAG